MTFRTLYNSFRERIAGMHIFMAIVFFLYVATGIVNTEVLITVFHSASTLFMRILPVLILVFALMYISNLFLDAKKIRSLVGVSTGVRGWIIAIVTGIISSGPIYMWYPLLADLREKGMREGYIATFLYNRAVKVPMLPLMIFYFGLPFTLALSLWMIVLSVIQGVCINILIPASENDAV